MHKLSALVSTKSSAKEKAGLSWDMLARLQLNSVFCSREEQIWFYLQEGDQDGERSGSYILRGMVKDSSFVKHNLGGGDSSCPQTLEGPSHG